MIKVSKLTDDFYSQCFLAFDEFPVKEVNQNITFSKVQRVLPQLNDRTTESRRSHLFRTFPDWFSHDSLNHSQRGNKKGRSGGHLPIPCERKMGSRLNSESHRPPGRALPLWFRWFAGLCGFPGFRRRAASAAGKFSFRWNCQYIGLSE